MISISTLRRTAAGMAFFWLVSCSSAQVHAATIAEIIARVQPKIVKVYGAGGVRGLEAYQSGFLVTDSGHILTIWSTVLDTDSVTVVLDDGRRYPAEVVGADLEVETAVLKINAAELPHFRLSVSSPPPIGARILAFSNLFGVATGREPVSVQQGTIASLTKLDARRGIFATPYRGEVFVIDAVTNNPGAAGGALVGRDGELLAMLGKELKNASNDTWLNYAVPASVLRTALDRIIEGKTAGEERNPPTLAADEAWESAAAGMRLVPEVLDRTPPFVDAVSADSAAAIAGLKADDLILYVNGQLVQTCQDVAREFRAAKKTQNLLISVMRDNQLHELVLRPKGSGK